jgi:hypothetical protein
VVGLQRPRALEIFIDNHSGARDRGGATGLRARPELHLGAAQSGSGTANHRDRDPDADNHAASDTDDNHTAAALQPANDCVAAAVRSARHDDVATARPGADTPGRAATARLRADTSAPAASARLALMARLLSARGAGASSPGALMARLLLGRHAGASSPGAGHR